MQQISTRTLKTLFVLCVVAALSWVAASTAHAAQRDEVVDAILADGYFVEPGSGESPTEVADALRAIRLDGFEWALVVLADSSEPAEQFATDVLLDLDAAASPVDTVVVKSPEDVGAHSFVYDATDLDAAFDGSIDAFRRSGVNGFTAFAAELSTSENVGTPNPLVPSTGEATSGLGAFLAFLAAPIAAVAGGIWFFGRRRKQQAHQEQEEDITEARNEIRSQLSAVADRIVELDSQVVMVSPEGQTRFQEASQTYAAVDDDVETVTTLAQLEALAQRIDVARWQVEAVQAEIEGKPIPAEPSDRPARCFFDPNHRAGVEEAEIKTEAGNQSVSVCVECAEKLDRGQRPDAREVVVGGNRVPVSTLPQSHGGLGLGGLGLFEILRRGMGGSGIGYDWTGSGGWGPGTGTGRRGGLGGGYGRPTRSRRSFPSTRSRGRVGNPVSRRSSSSRSRGGSAGRRLGGSTSGRRRGGGSSGRRL